MDERPPKGAKAFAVKITMDLVIIAKEKEEIDESMVFQCAKEQYECVSPELAKEMLQVKRILRKEDIPEGWEDGIPWNDGDVDLTAEHYIPSPLEALAEQAE